LQVAAKPITQDFHRPKSAAEFLGIAAGLQNRIDESDARDAGSGTLADGSAVRLLKVGFGAGGPEEAADTYWIFKIRSDNNTIAEMEWVASGESLLVVRRVRTETVDKPGVGWNLAGIEPGLAQSQGGPKVGITPDMVVPDVSVERMVDKADFETYIFASDPPWATAGREITDILDLPSPPHRMFAVSYRAGDGRHVVLVQSHSYNKMLGPMSKMGKLVYASPSGVKVWSGPYDKWLAGILLKSAQYAIKDRPSEDRTGYLLETPAGTFPVVAVNGSMTEEELHGLIDSLVPAREYLGR
jgi:hypothetical protein